MAERAYTLFWTVQKEPPGGIKVTADIPAGWREKLDEMGSPTFEQAGSYVTIVAIHAAGADEGARMDWALHQQYGNDVPVIERQPRSGGRIFAIKRKPGSVHARMFLPAPHDSVVMAVAMLFGAPVTQGAVDDIAAVFDTVKVLA